MTLEVAPTRDLFVLFEFPVVELPSGWYAIECRIAIDGSPETVRPGSRFAIPWPRGATRRAIGSAWGARSRSPARRSDWTS